jgi:hypothetical protein
LAVALVVGAVATACSGGSGGVPAGSGNDVINDTRDAEPRAPQNPTPADDGGPESGNNPPYYPDGGGSVVYPGLAECGDCTCDPGKGYCFGGATARDVRVHEFTPLGSPKDAGGDAGLPACVMIDAGSPQLGCNALPSGCPAGANACACIINLLQATYACDLVCADDGDGTPMTVYCPNG